MSNISQQQLQQYQDLADKALDYLKRIKAGENMNLKDEIYKNSNEIQSLINLIFKKQLNASQQEIDKLEELARIQRVKMLELESKDAKRRFRLYGGIALVLILGIVFYKYKQKKI
jgi:hypothetical protein